MELFGFGRRGHRPKARPNPSYEQNRDDFHPGEVTAPNANLTPMNTALLVIHILSAAAWFGADLTLLVQSKTATADFWRTALGVGRRLQTPAAILLLLSGVGLVLTDDEIRGFDAPFITIGVAVIVIGAVMGSRVLPPRYRRAADLLDAGDHAGHGAVARNLRSLGTLEVALLAIAVIAMVGKWGA